MKFGRHSETLGHLINEYEERASRGKMIDTGIRDRAKRQARETLGRILIDSDPEPRWYTQDSCMALSDRVWHLLESYFYACYANIDFPKPASQIPLHLFALQDTDIAAANLGFHLANAKAEREPINAGVVARAELDITVYQFHWMLY